MFSFHSIPFLPPSVKKEILSSLFPTLPSALLQALFRFEEMVSLSLFHLALFSFVHSHSHTHHSLSLSLPLPVISV
jgi:hypothetical protein